MKVVLLVFAVFTGLIFDTSSNLAFAGWLGSNEWVTIMTAKNGGLLDPEKSTVLSSSPLDLKDIAECDFRFVLANSKEEFDRGDIVQVYAANRVSIAQIQHASADRASDGTVVYINLTATTNLIVGQQPTNFTSFLASGDGIATTGKKIFTTTPGPGTPQLYFLQKRCK